MIGGGRRTRPSTIRRPRPINHDRWLVSYADFTTLLFALFATMYAMSTIDAQKLSAAVDGMQSAFATPRLSAAVLAPGAPKPLTPIVPSPEGALEGVRLRLHQVLASELAARRLELAVDRRGLVISILEAGSFAEGRAELAPGVRAVVDAIATAVAAIPNDIRVEGHTDDTAIGSGRYASNWELSSARATAVVAQLIGAGGVSPARLSAAGYGEFQPRVANDSVAARALNRRVVVVVLNSATSRAEAP